MKRLLRIAGVILGLLIACTFMLAACVKEKTPPEGDVTVTFDYNYDGAPGAYVTEVDEYGLVTPPTEPKRRNYRFDGWWQETACTNRADFEYEITKDTTFYAKWVKTGATVTFDPNYEGAEKTEKDVPIGSTVEQPTDPERDDFLFEGWFTQKTGGEKFSFETPVQDDMTLYGEWSEVAEDTDTITIIYQYNYAGAGQYYKAIVRAGRRVEKPGDPKRDGYYFAGWYLDEAGSESFDFTREKPEQSLTLYARWLKTYTFEAEYTDLTGKEGNGYSGETGGTDLIVNDKNGKLGESSGLAGASNGFYLGSLYQQGLSIDFVINSDQDVDDAVLELRLSVEYIDKRFDPTLFAVEVNGETIPYAPITLDGAVPQGEDQEKGIRPFTNHLITVSLKLKKGENTIKLIVTNDIDRGGTMFADAPAIDCMYIHTDATLTWTPKENNLNGKI